MNPPQPWPHADAVSPACNNQSTSIFLANSEVGKLQHRSLVDDALLFLGQPHAEPGARRCSSLRDVDNEDNRLPSTREL